MVLPLRCKLQVATPMANDASEVDLTDDIPTTQAYGPSKELSPLILENTLAEDIEVPVATTMRRGKYRPGQGRFRSFVKRTSPGRGRVRSLVKRTISGDESVEAENERVASFVDSIIVPEDDLSNDTTPAETWIGEMDDTLEGVVDNSSPRGSQLAKGLPDSHEKVFTLSEELATEDGSVRHCLNDIDDVLDDCSFWSEVESDEEVGLLNGEQLSGCWNHVQVVIPALRPY